VKLGIVPGESVFIGRVVLVGHEVDKRRVMDREESMRDAHWDRYSLVGGEYLSGSTRRSNHPPKIDERHEHLALRNDPVIDLTKVVVKSTQDARLRVRQVRLDERDADGARPIRFEEAKRACAPNLTERSPLVTMWLHLTRTDSADPIEPLGLGLQATAPSAVGLLFAPRSATRLFARR
jgi:hypothetical protein